MEDTLPAQSVTLDKEPSGNAFLWIDVPGKTYNVLNQQVLAELDSAFDRVATDSTIKFLVILGRKKTGFIAGADLNEFKTITEAHAAIALSEKGQRLFNKLEALPIPSIAVIQGPCLGGGLELALACDYRLVVDQANTQIGLPEIELGLVPGWGGTQRLPRVIGLEHAFHVILLRRRLNAREAHQWGLAHGIFTSQEEAVRFVREQLAKRIKREGKRLRKNLPLRTWRQRLLESTGPARALLFRGAERIVRRKVPDDMPAPKEALQAMRVGLSQGIAAGLAREREAIGRLATTKACRNLITLFFLMEKARKLEESPEKNSVPEIHRVGVVGAGTMGAGIAQLAAIKGFEVVVQEINDPALSAGRKRIETLFAKAVERRLLSGEDAENKLAAFGWTTAWQGFEKADLVIEAAIEDLAMKREIFRELDRRTRPDAILATNTSSLLVRQMQEGLTHPERVGGLHFFNPVHKMPLVEVIRAQETQQSVTATLTRWAAALGKTPVTIADSPGFVVNRILMPYLNEAGILVAEGVPIERADQAMRRFGMLMGPLEVLDQVGLDVAAHVAKSARPAFGDRLTPHPALERMCQEGWLGQKTGLGFYRYRGKKKTVHKEALAKLRQKSGAPSELEAMLSADQMEQARERMVCLMVNEAAACLAEGLAAQPDAIDLAMVLGTGWAPHRGGPLRYADDRGAGEIVKTLEKFTKDIGPRFEPCAELRRHAESRQLFYGHPAALQSV
jgi:3-hydroxyacyl-CoA dehydrogenase/enoyl-CoA hydratase/3-hydroxybutyryl-CoA epimerase